MSERRERLPRGELIALTVFGAAFGFVEAAVVFYLRRLITTNFTGVFRDYHVIVNLGFITFIRPAHQLLFPVNIADVEVARETATIVMLAAVAWAVARAWPRRLGAFMVGFASWDLTYYLWLRIIDHWPESLFTRDVFFLIPVPWIGPVITPLVISSVIYVLGARLFLTGRVRRQSRVEVDPDGADQSS